MKILKIENFRNRNFSKRKFFEIENFQNRKFSTKSRKSKIFNKSKKIDKNHENQKFPKKIENFRKKSRKSKIFQKNKKCITLLSDGTLQMSL